MCISLRPKKTDDWLMRLGDMEPEAVPLVDILTNSMFYPASGFDCDPVRHLLRYTTTFVYCDYDLALYEINRLSRVGWLSGYRVLWQRDVRQDEIAPSGFQMPPLVEGDGDPSQRASYRSAPIFRWLVYERSGPLADDELPRRLSIVFLGIDGVAGFNELYLKRGIVPAAIAVIQPGHGCGTNYTNFESPSQVLARLVLSNPAGIPDILMFGGNQDEAYYAAACWPRYRRLIARPNRSEPGHLGVWTWRHLRTVLP